MEGKGRPWWTRKEGGTTRCAFHDFKLDVRALRCADAGAPTRFVKRNKFAQSRRQGGGQSKGMEGSASAPSEGFFSEHM